MECYEDVGESEFDYDWEGGNKKMIRWTRLCVSHT